MTDTTLSSSAETREHGVGLTAAALGATALARPAAAAGNPANQPPNIADWTRMLGDGVAVRKYGKPSKHEAGVIRRDVAWLTATMRCPASSACAMGTSSTQVHRDRIDVPSMPNAIRAPIMPPSTPPIPPGSGIMLASIPTK